MREKRRGYPVVVSIGYGTNKKEKGLVKGKKPVKIMNLKDLEKMNKNQIGILGKVGKKNTLEIAKLAEKKGIELANLNIKKTLKGEKKNESK